MKKKLNTPILFLTFNRPDLTQCVFNEIKKAKPKQLFWVSDGPRNKKEKELVKKTRKIIKQVDWDCEVRTNFSDKNLGCKERVSSGIDWFFKNVEQGIILEDDCLPNQSFFIFCEQLLNKYKDNEHIMHISGDNFQHNNKKFECDDSYWFSLIPHIWGWATWRRAWNTYDVNITTWPQIKKEDGLLKIFKDPAIAHRWEYLFKQYYNRSINSWDGQWAFNCFIHNGLSISPTCNLISNIGFGRDATHSKDTSNELSNLTTSILTLPLKHPKIIMPHKDADDYTHKYIYGINRYNSQKIKWFFKSKFPSLYFFLKKWLKKTS